jgi:hypothetical protein
VFENSKLETRTFSPMWWGHGEALHVTAFAWNEKGFLEEGNPERLLEGKVSNITFRDLRVDSEAGILNWAARPELVNDIRYENIKLKIGTRSKWPHRIDLRPNDISPVVERPHNAFEAVNVSTVSVTGLEIEWDENSRLSYGEGVFTQNAPGFIANQVTEIAEEN